jgi:PIN domain nuclease of toxin-antitoxin system
LIVYTHGFLWWRANDQLLQGAAGTAIADADVVFVSAATAWEAGIKVSLVHRFINTVTYNY